jgi:hypothetical protein
MPVPRLTWFIDFANWLKLHPSERKTLGFNIFDIGTNGASIATRSPLLPQWIQNTGAVVVAALKGMMVLSSGSVGNDLFDSHPDKSPGATTRPTALAHKFDHFVSPYEAQPFTAMALTALFAALNGASMMLRHHGLPGSNTCSYLAALVGAGMSLNETSARQFYLEDVPEAERQTSIEDPVELKSETEHHAT